MQKICYDDFKDPYFVKQIINNIAKDFEGYRYFMIKRIGDRLKIIICLDAEIHVMNQLIDINYNAKMLDKKIRETFKVDYHQILDFNFLYEFRYI